MSNEVKILVIDDEPQIRKLLKIGLESQGYKIIEADSGKIGLAVAALNKPELIILDLGLPDEDGIEILKQLREWSKIPVIILSVRGDETDKIDALDNGADDYVTKPFSIGELSARIRAALRHAEPEMSDPVFVNGSLKVDLSARIVMLGNETIKLTATEYSIIKLFVENAGKVLTHKLLMREIWGAAFVEDTQYLRVYIANIRKKIEVDPSNPKYITTESGIGYRMNLIS